MRKHIEDLIEAKAIVSRMPVGSGDGYGYGGGIILTIGNRSLFVGESHYPQEFAEELAERWNAKDFSTQPQEEQERQKGR